MTSSSNLFANDPLWQRRDKPTMENENLNGLNGKPTVQILLQEHSRITFDSVSVGFDNKTTRAEQEEPHQLDVETLPGSIVEGMEDRWLAAMAQNDFFFDRLILTAFLSMLIMIRIFIHSFHFGGREFAIPIKNESPFSTSKLLDTLRNWQRSHLKRWNAASKARRQTSKRSSLWSFRVHTRYDIYNQQPLGHWGLIPR